MKNVIVITGHGQYATGLKSSIELIAGENKDVYYLDLTIHDTDQTLKSKINTVVKQNTGAGVLFICDILGGTPFKAAVEIANQSDYMEVVAGCNIGSILEGIMQKDQMSVGELADSMVVLSQKTTVRFAKNTNNYRNDVVEINDGI